MHTPNRYLSEAAQAVSRSMIFVLSIMPSAVVAAGYAYLVMYRGETTKRRIVQAVLRFVVSCICYLSVYLMSMLALGALYLAFDWYSGSETAFRMQFVGLSLFANLCSIFFATRRL